ncbi:hypothetical protein GH733_006290 [Mirounga leonina]|nr:hypothetical protein GH733_006290 [Mirounga leonina]
MDGLGSSCPASHCRDLLPHPVLGRPPAPLGAPQGAVYTDIPAPEAARQCAPPPAPPTSSSATLGYGYPFGGSYYGCRLSHNVNLQQKPCAYHPGDKYPEPSGALPGDDLSSRAKEFAFYPSFASSYQAMPGYLDVSVVPGISGHPEPRHDALIPVEGYQHWALSNGWDSKEGARVPPPPPPPPPQPGTPPRPACPGAPRLSHPRRLAPARRLCWAADGACRASCAEECAGEEICSDTFPGAARPRVKQSQAPERRAARSARVGSSPPPPPARSSLTRGSWPPEARFQPGMGVSIRSPDVVPLQPEVSSYRRGRKKRVPYTKVQLKELEKEYAASKFITKEKRRRISATTNLSERQVTIWFQNRRVKEKKVVSKSKAPHLHST